MKGPRKNQVYAGGNVEEHTQAAPSLANGVGCKTSGREGSKSLRRK